MTHTVDFRKNRVPTRQRYQGNYVIVVSVCLSVVLSVSRITHERVNGRRPNMVGMDEG